MILPPLSRRLVAEFLGTVVLLATVVGSGIMAQRLAGGNDALALLGNTLPTGAILVVLITMLGPISGAHFNPAVTLTFLLRRELTAGEAGAYVLAQVAGALIGTLAAHGMFELSLLQLSVKARSGPAQGFAEWVATFGLCHCRDVGRTLHYRRLLVHGFHLVCQSRRDAGPRIFRHVRRHQARGRAPFHRGTARRRGVRASGGTLADIVPGNRELNGMSVCDLERFSSSSRRPCWSGRPPRTVCSCRIPDICRNASRSFR